ncbi:MAG: M1 family metallopeptidase, partial [Chloroflexota bacterium]
MRLRRGDPSPGAQRTDSVMRLASASVLIFVFVLSSLAWPATASAQTAPSPHYRIDLNLDLDAASADVRQVVDYTNNTGTELPSLVFHITAAYYKAFDLKSTRVDGKDVNPTLDGIVLEVPLPEALPAGKSTQVTFDYGLAIPRPGNLRFGASGGIIALGNWYPVLSVYRTGDLTYDGRLPVGWDRHQQGTPDQLARGVEPGDAFFTDVADYDVDVTLSKPATVAHTGETVAADPAAGTLSLRARGVRDFALAVSDRYETATADVDGTTVTVFYLPEHRAGGQQYLDSTRKAVAWFNKTLGRYPYSYLHVVETTSNDGAWVGQEYPNVVFISSQMTAGPTGMGSYLSYLVIHEVLHQWFYALVGDDQLYEPWVDEALTTHMSYRFLESVDAELGRVTWQNLADRRKEEEAIWPDMPVNTSIYDYSDEGHYFAM